MSWVTALRRKMITGVALGLLLCSPQAEEICGEDTVAVAVQRIADQIQPVLAEKKLLVISVGRFSSAAGTSTGSEVQVKLADAIARLNGFQLNDVDYDVKISGRIENMQLANALAVKIVAQLFDANNQPIVQFNGSGQGVEADIIGQEAVPRLIGITSNSAGDDRVARNQKLLRDLDSDPSVIKSAEVFSGTDGKYSVEVRVKDCGKVDSPYQPVAATKKGRRGNAFAEIPMGKSFAVVLRNYSDKEAAVNLTLDGISSFAFSEIRRGSVYWLLPPATQNGPGIAIIRGWDKNDNESFEFKTVEYPESAAAKLKIESNEAIGQICAQFSEALPASSETSRAAGIGEIIDDKKSSEPRSVGSLQETIHVRYERPKGQKKS